MANSVTTIQISLKNVLSIIGLLIGLYFLYYIRDIILFAFIGVLIMAALNPLILRLEQLKVNRGLSIGIVYLTVLTLLVVAVAAIIPPLVNQTVTLINQIPIPENIAESLRTIQLSLQDVQVIANQLNSVPKVLGFLGSAFSGFIVFVSLLVFSFYLLIERSQLKQHLASLMRSKERKNEALEFVNKVEYQIGSWVRAEVALMVIVGALTYVGLIALGINYALALAIIAGLLEVLPNLGPTLAAVPAIAVAYITLSPAMALAVAVLYILVQQVENNLIVPMVMRSVVGISPVITILLLLIGFRLAGVAGAALAIPLFLVLKVVFVEYRKLQQSAR